MRSRFKKNLKNVAPSALRCKRPVCSPSSSHGCRRERGPGYARHRRSGDPSAQDDAKVGENALAGYLISGFIGACLLIWIVRALRAAQREDPRRLGLVRQ